MGKRIASLAAQSSTIAAAVKTEKSIQRLARMTPAMTMIRLGTCSSEYLRTTLSDGCFAFMGTHRIKPST
jgi:hypothetical protein